uniref:Uncharacterized protein n=1 Tax=Arundo donax TaxID=35708 RepID=A0A0A9C271_ARUDO
MSHHQLPCCSSQLTVHSMSWTKHYIRPRSIAAARLKQYAFN